MTSVQRRERRAKAPVVVAILLLTAPLAGCGAYWNADWGGCHSGGHIHAQGSGASGVIVLGILGIAWGIEELFEALGRR